MGQVWDGRTCTGTASNFNLTTSAALTGKTTFAGQTDWRLPNIRELRSIADTTRLSPAIDTEAFPNTPLSYFLSSTANSGSPTYYRWVVNFQDAYVSDSSSGGYTRLVRGGQSTGAMDILRPTTDYVANTDGTATHRPSNLTWQRCAVGRTWTGSACTGTASSLTLAQASALTSNFAGKSDWRLPTAAELETLVTYTNLTNVLNSTIFRSTAGSDVFWSSSQYLPNTANSWYLRTSDGVLSYTSPTVAFQVMLVRSDASTVPVTPALAPNLLTLTGSSALQSGASTLLTATARYTDNSLRTVNPAWTSSNPAAATVNAAGVVSAGIVSTATTVTISASWTENGATVQGSLVVTVSAAPAVVSSLKLTGATSVQSAGQVPLVLNAGYSDGSSKAVSATSFAVSNAALGSINTFGVLKVSSVTADTPLTVTATYTEAGVTVTAQLQVLVLAPAPVTPVNTLPPNLLTLTGSNVLQSGARTALIATAQYTDNSQRTVTPVWTSSNPVAASVSVAGVVTAGVVSTNTPVTITATWTENGATVQSTLVVTVSAVPAMLSDLKLTGATSVQSAGQVRLVLSAVYADGSSKVVSPTSFALSNPALGSVNSRGVLSVAAVTVNTTLTVTATYAEGGITMTASLPITITAAPVVLTRLTLVGASALLVSDQTLSLSALGVYEDGSSKPVAPTWKVAGTAATVSNAGLFKAMPVSTDTPVIVSASYTEGGITVTAEFQVIIQGLEASTPIQAEVQATGTSANFSLALWTSATVIAPSDAPNAGARGAGTAHPAATGRPVYKLFVVTVVPGGKVVPVDTIFTLNRNGEWQGLSFPIAEYLNGVADNSVQLIEILDKLDVSIISGSKIYVGYGTDDQEMIAAGRFRLVYQIQ